MSYWREIKMKKRTLQLACIMMLWSMTACLGVGFSLG